MYTLNIVVMTGKNTVFRQWFWCNRIVVAAVAVLPFIGLKVHVIRQKTDLGTGYRNKDTVFLKG